MSANKFSFIAYSDKRLLLRCRLFDIVDLLINHMIRVKEKKKNKYHNHKLSICDVVKRLKLLAVSSCTLQLNLLCIKYC